MSFHYRPEIDGLRAVAVASVVVFHAFPGTLPGGFVGVDIFFVISGYLISSIILRDAAAHRFNIGSFYLRRARRVFPALFLTLTACLGAGWFLLPPAELIKLGEHSAAATLFAANLLSWSQSGYFDVSSVYKPLLHLWSLGIEEQFYVFWPLLLAGFARRRTICGLILLAVFGASLAWSVHSVTTDPTAAYYSPLSRTWELAAGGVLAWLDTSGRERTSAILADLFTATGFACLIYAFMTLSETAPFPGWNAVVPVLGTVLIIASSGRGVIAGRVLGNKFMAGVGLISYPLYLWHWPLLSFSYMVLDEPPSSSLKALLVCISIGLAVTTYLFVERPIRTSKTLRKAAPILGSSGLVAAGLCGFFIYLLNGVPSRFPEEIRQVLSYGNYTPEIYGRHPACWVFPKIPVSQFPTECRFKNDGKEKILIWGDSHAAMLYSGIREVMGSDADIAQFTRISCPPLLGFPGYCGQANHDMLTQIAEDKPDVLVLFGAWANYEGISPDYDQSASFRSTIDAVKQLGVPKVVVVGPAPFWSPFLPTQVYRAWARDIPLRRLPDRLTSRTMAGVERWDAEMGPEAIAAGDSYFALKRFFCNDDGCLTHTDRSKHELLIFDNGHLTKEGAVMVARKMKSERLLN